MIWEEWVNSEYNVDVFFYFQNDNITNGGYMCIIDSLMVCNKLDLIIHNEKI
jgi:hypothetical protein